MNNTLSSWSVPNRVVLRASQTLLARCNARLCDEIPAPSAPLVDHGRHLNWAIGYMVGGIDAVASCLELDWKVHAKPVTRSLFEMSQQLLWASRGRWDRYWAYVAKEEIGRRRYLREYVEHHAELLTGDDDTELEEIAACATPMPSLRQVLRDIFQDDASEPDSLFAPSDSNHIADADSLYAQMLKNDLHPATHADPKFLLQKDDLRIVGQTVPALVYCTTSLVRAVHIELQWDQRPILWAYNWICQGRRHDSEPTRENVGSYGDLAVPKLLDLVSYVS